MKRLSIFITLCFVLLSCGSKPGPNGDAESDAKELCEALVTAYHNNNIKQMSDAIGEYYRFYKKEDKADKEIFFKALKDCIEEYEKEIDHDKFQTMINKADPYNKMDKLYHEGK